MYTTFLRFPDLPSFTGPDCHKLFDQKRCSVLRSLTGPGCFKRSAHTVWTHSSGQAPGGVGLGAEARLRVELVHMCVRR
jgi:hypothetical protein